MKRELFDRNVFITCDGDRGKKGGKKGKKKKCATRTQYSGREAT